MKSTMKLHEIYYLNEKANPKSKSKWNENANQIKSNLKSISLLLLGALLYRATTDSYYDSDSGYYPLNVKLWFIALSV